MALQNIKGKPICFPAMPSSITTTPTMSNSNAARIVDGASEKFSWIMKAPKAGNITKIHMLFGLVNTVGSNPVDIRVETVDATTGAPTGTLLSANSNLTLATASTQTWASVTLTGAAAVTLGLDFAVVIANPATNFWDFAMADFTDADAADTHFPYTNQFIAAWTKRQTTVPMLMEFDDGSFFAFPISWPFAYTTIAASFSSSDTPDVHALKFTLPWTCQIMGSRIWADTDGTWKVNLYDSAGNILAATPTNDDDVEFATTAGLLDSYFTAPYTLAANTVYYLGLEPQSASAITLYEFDEGIAGCMSAFEGGAALHLATAKDPHTGGAWTPTTTRRPWISLLIDKLDDNLRPVGGSTIKGWTGTY